MRAPEKTKLNSRTIATITVAPRTSFPYDTWLDDVYVRAKEQRELR